VTFPDLVRPLADVRGGDRPAVGGKAASLGEMTAAGIRVPPGFAVTTAAFGHALRALDPDGAIARQIERLDPADAAGIHRVTAGIREAIVGAPLPARVREAIADRYRAMPAPDGPAAAPGISSAPVAVRSSATSEDSASASFAGLQETYLWVQGEAAVAGYVRRCWASLYSVESVTYRRHRHVPEHGLAMGVVVQAMVDPRCAGVMFTRSPVTGDTSVIVVEASWGLGSALVSGDVTPDSYVVSKVTGEILRRTVASKLRHHQRDNEAGGVRLRDVPPELRDVPCLADEEVRALASLGRRVSEHYGTPQDIEWAITADGGSPVLLQCRPETVWAGRAVTPVAVPKARAFDHVLDQLGAPGGPGAPGGATR
jgi:pyruvate, water dikinase